jgi:hypothetical protein
MGGLNENTAERENAFRRFALVLILAGRLF